MKHLKNRWIERLRRIRFLLWLHEDDITLLAIFIIAMFIATLGATR